jgi:hypothetical protein
MYHGNRNGITRPNQGMENRTFMACLSARRPSYASIFHLRQLTKVHHQNEGKEVPAKRARGSGGFPQESTLPLKLKVVVIYGLGHVQASKSVLKCI